MTKIFFCIIGITGSFFVGAYAAKEIACKCLNKTVQFPACGVCGSESGTMEKTELGISCVCENNLKLSDVSCEKVCADHGGWSGDFTE